MQMSHEDPQDRARPGRQMRGLLIAQDEPTSTMWSCVLRRKGIEPVRVHDGEEAVGIATPHGFDLIVLAGSLGSVDRETFAGLVNSGRFGARPPPLIVHVCQFGDILEAGEGAFAGHIVVEGSTADGLAQAIDLAFVGLDGNDPGRGIHDA